MNENNNTQLTSKEKKQKILIPETVTCTVALIFAIASLILIIIMPPVGIICALLGIYCGVRYLKKFNMFKDNPGNSTAMGAIICSCIGLFFCIIATIAWYIVLTDGLGALIPN
jgi:hypothetical protein